MSAVQSAAAPAPAQPGVDRHPQRTEHTVVQLTPTASIAQVQLADKEYSEQALEARISIPSIKLNAPIVPVGVTATNEIAVPADMSIGRWIGSSDFGQPGTTFLDGHVYGVFANLHQVRSGATVAVNQNGQIYSYLVTHLETYSLEDVDMSALLHTYTASEGLVVMTCAGDYLPKADTYSKRLVVYAKRVY